MTYDDWKSTDTRDAEPDREQEMCLECRGIGVIVFTASDMEHGEHYASRDCEACNSRGWVWVKP